MARSTYEEEVISKIAARTPQQWRSAFLKLWDEHKITKNQRKMLCVHYEAPRHTLGQAAVACGRRGRQQTADSGMLWALAPLRESDFHTSPESHQSHAKPRRLEPGDLGVLLSSPEPHTMPNAVY